MAFLVVLQRLTPAERAVLLLHDVFVAATTASSAGTLRVERHELNGQPAIVFWTGEQPFAALLLAVADGKVQRVFFHADPHRLRYLGRRVA